MRSAPVCMFLSFLVSSFFVSFARLSVSVLSSSLFLPLSLSMWFSCPVVRRSSFDSMIFMSGHDTRRIPPRFLFSPPVPPAVYSFLETLAHPAYLYNHDLCHHVLRPFPAAVSAHSLCFPERMLSVFQRTRYSMNMMYMCSVLVSAVLEPSCRYKIKLFACQRPCVKLRLLQVLYKYIHRIVPVHYNVAFSTSVYSSSPSRSSSSYTGR